MWAQLVLAIFVKKSIPIYLSRDAENATDTVSNATIPSSTQTIKFPIQSIFPCFVIYEGNP